MKIVKFGGSSLADLSCCERVKNIIQNNPSQQKQIVVVSAFGGVTDQLKDCLQLAESRNENYKTVLLEIQKRHQQFLDDLQLDDCQNNLNQQFRDLQDYLHAVYLLEEVSEKVKNHVMGAGELLSSVLVSRYFAQSGLQVKHFDSRKFIVLQEGKGVYLNQKETEKRIREIEDDFEIAVFPGFIASGSEGEMLLLGRGGSDYTASVLAAGFNCSDLEIWTDVSGMYTADPRLVRQAMPIRQMSYQEAMELSHFGAKVLYPPTLIPVIQNKIRVRIKNTFAPEEQGTIIAETPQAERSIVRGLSSVNEMNLLTLSGSGVIGISGFASRYFSCLAKSNVNVVLITQASSEHSISVGIHKDDADRAVKSMRAEFEREIALEFVNQPQVEENLSIVAIVGEDMGRTPGISGKVFSILGRNGVNIRATAQGGNELNITFMVKSSDVKKALNVIHEGYFLSANKKVNLYIAGLGNVGKKLMESIAQQSDYLKQEKALDLIVRGITNSRKMLFAENELPVEHWEQLLEEQGEAANFQDFVARMDAANLRNSIFVDITASDEVSDEYARILQATVSIVACNKIAASSSFENYKYIKGLAKKHNVEFMYESNVGAGLPVISTINSLVHTGDEITGIEAVVSGSLNFIMNEFSAGKSFADAVQLAMEAGFTEPDPKIDLSGMDVLRKLLILSREAGFPLEETQVDHEAMIPQDCLQTNGTEDLLESLRQHNDHFEQWRKRMKEEKVCYRYIASYQKGKAKVALQAVPSDHPFYNIQGKDNVISLTTKWYHDQPLIVKGAGAGAEVTASGIFGDIIRVSM